VERRAENPVLPPSLFRRRAVVASFVVVALGTGAVLLGTMNYLPLYLQLVQGRSASSSGLLLLPMLLPAIATAVVTGAWTSRPGRFRTAMVAGTALLATGSALMATMDAGTSAWTTAAFMAVGGVGVGLLFQTPTVLVQNSAPADEVGAATGAAGFMRMIGGAVGVGAFGALFSSTLSGYVADHVTTGQGPLDVTALTPDELAGLPAAVRSVVTGAVVAGSSALFWAAAAAALVAVLAALTVPRVRAHAATGEESDAGPVARVEVPAEI
jgi:MFS family permease